MSIQYRDYYWGLYRDYNRDPFPHSLLSIRQIMRILAWISRPSSGVPESLKPEIKPKPLKPRALNPDNPKF